MIRHPIIYRSNGSPPNRRQEAGIQDRFRSFFDRRLRLPSSGGNGERHEASGEGRTAGKTSPDAETRSRLRLAACVLLLEIAHADREFLEIERAHIEAVLRRHFALDPVTAAELVEVAEATRQTVEDVRPFAELIRSGYDLGQRTLLAEIMWGLILADGRIAQHEAHLLHRITSLLDLEPGYLSGGA